MKHGTISTYVNHACRCATCTCAWRQYQSNLRLRRAERPIPDTVQHGKVSTYNNWSCRCELCTAAKAAQNAAERARRQREAT